MIAFSEVALIAALGLMLPINHNRVAAFQRWLRRWPISRQAVNERFALSNRLEMDLRASELTHPHRAVGEISTYECLLLMGAHAQRHALQIEEVKQSQAYRAETGK